MSEHTLVLGSAASTFALFALVACSGAPAANETDTTSTDESQLVAAQSSLEASNEQVQACFDTFRTCAEQSGGQIDACREALRRCLPQRPPDARRCGPLPPPPAPPGGDCDHDAGARPPPPPAPPPSFAPSSATLPPPPPPGHCGPPPIPPGEMVACHAKLDACVKAGGDHEQCFREHHACIRDAFARHFAELCQRAGDACAAGKLPAEECERITSACSRGLPSEGE